MKQFGLNLLQILIKILRYLLITGLFFLMIGLIGVFVVYQSSEGMVSLPYNIPNERVPLMFLVLILIIAIGIFLCFIFITIFAEKLVANLRDDIYFVEENRDYISKIRLSLWIWTGLQLLVALLSSVFKVEHLSDLFEVSLGNYFWNILFLVVSYAGSSMMQRGIQLKQMNDEII